VTSHPVGHCVAGGLALTKDAGLTVEDVWARMEEGRVGRRDRGSTAANRAQAQPRDEAGRFTAEGVEREQARADDLALWRDALLRFLKGVIAPGMDLRVGRVPQVLRRLGVPSGVMVMRGSKVRTVIKEHAAIGRDVMLNLPNLIADPDLVFSQTGKESDFLVVTPERVAGGKPVVVAIKAQGVTSDGKPATVVLTVYEVEEAAARFGDYARRDLLQYQRDERSGAEFELTGAASLRGSRSSDPSAPASRRKILTAADVFKGDDSAPLTREQRVTPPSAVALPNGMAYAPDPDTYAEIEEANAAVRAGGGERVARPLSHQSRGAVV
jgi:hypothetical protein